MENYKTFIYIAIAACILIITNIFSGCYILKQKDTIKLYEDIFVNDTTLINNLEDTLIGTINYYEDSLMVLNHNVDSLTTEISKLTNKDKVYGEMLLYKYKIERIKSYTSIVDNNPSQMTFYKGWIKRVLSE